jgi:hypothetical protein
VFSPLVFVPGIKECHPVAVPSPSHPELHVSGLLHCLVGLISSSVATSQSSASRN